MMNPKQPASSVPLKFALAAGGTAILFVSAIAVAWHTRHCRMTGALLFNCKGGRMTYTNGYYIALTLFALTIAWFVAAWRYWRETPE